MLKARINRVWINQGRVKFDDKINLKSHTNLRVSYAPSLYTHILWKFPKIYINVLTR